MSRSGTAPNPLANRLLAGLPGAERQRLVSQGESVPLPAREVLSRPREPLQYVYFPLQGVVSKLSSVDGDEGIEIGTVGREGMAGLPVFWGVSATPARLIVQVPGEAVRVPAEVLHQQAAPGSELQLRLCRYTSAFLTQIAQSVACNGLHSVKQRCCRWLLMTHDRVDGDQFPMTQELLARMLGVRRASVAEVARRLQGDRLIQSGRGTITILDRKGLEAAACACYRIIQDEYDRLLGPEGS